MSRTTKEEILRKNSRITFRLSNQELENLKTAADRIHVSESEYIRICLRDKPIQIKYQIVAESEPLNQIAHEIGRISSNLNQIGKYFNTGGIRSLAMEDAIHEAIYQLFDMREKIIELGGSLGKDVDCYRIRAKEEG